VRSDLHPKKLEQKAMLLLDRHPAHPSASILKLKDGRIIFLPKNTTTLIQLIDQAIICTFIACCHDELLGGSVNSKLQITEFLKTITLKNVGYSVSLSWGKVMPHTVGNCWKKSTGIDGITADEKKLIPFSKECESYM
jgi:hypothetical protein